jgi:hypothetical protein
MGKSAQLKQKPEARKMKILLLILVLLGDEPESAQLSKTRWNQLFEKLK